MNEEWQVLSEAEHAAFMAVARREYVKYIIRIGAFWLMVGFLVGRWT